MYVGSELLSEAKPQLNNKGYTFASTSDISPHKPHYKISKKLRHRKVIYTQGHQLVL